MPYPEFAKLSKHAASKLPEDKPKEKLKYTYELATAFLPRDINTDTREGQEKVLKLAFDELVKRTFRHDKNPKKRAMNLFMYDEDFPMEVVSQYDWYQKHGFPNVKDEIREQMPDSREEYMDKTEEEQRRLDPSCWKGYHKQGTKMKGGVRVNNCVKNESEEAVPSLYQFHKLLQNHDWTYEYSDDSRMYRRGQQQRKAIEDAIARGGQAYQDLYDKFVNQQKSGEKFEAPQKDKAELEQDRVTLNSMRETIEDVRYKMYHDIDSNSVYDPQQLWDLYYPAINILHAMKQIAQVKGYKTLLKVLAENNFK
jgi:hypothetical protein